MQKLSTFMASSCALTFGLLLAAGSLYAQVPETAVTPEDFADDSDYSQERVYSPYAGRAYPDQVLFGDMHFHTELSFDAGLIGTSLDAHDGFKVARGEKVISNTGQPVQLIRP